MSGKPKKRGQKRGDRRIYWPLWDLWEIRGVYALRQMADLAGGPGGKHTVRMAIYREGRPETEPPLPGAAEGFPTGYNVRTPLSAEVRPEANVLDLEPNSGEDIAQPAPDD